MAKPPPKQSFWASLFKREPTAAEQREANIQNLLTAVRSVTPEQRAAIRQAIAKSKQK